MTNQQLFDQCGVTKVIAHEEVVGHYGRYMVDVQFKNGHIYTSNPREGVYPSEINTQADIITFVKWCIEQEAPAETNQQILTKAIQKAVDGGWMPYFASLDPSMRKDNIIIRYHEGATHINFDYEMRGHIVGVGGYNMEPLSIIFNHDFAKALWGEHTESTVDEDGNDLARDYAGAAHGSVVRTVREGWRHHLQRMVIAEDPIKYLGEHI